MRDKSRTSAKNTEFINVGIEWMELPTVEIKLNVHKYVYCRQYLTIRLDYVS